MEWIQQAIRDFGASRGLDGPDSLEFDPNAVLELSLQGEESLGIACLPELPLQEMLVYTSAPLQFDPLPQMEAALRLSNARNNLYGPVQVGIHDGRLILAMHLPARAFDRPTLEQAVDSLLEMQRRSASGF